jgi:hypothetical protein
MLIATAVEHTLTAAQVMMAQSKKLLLKLVLQA